jgi:PAS domain S-box-containing protein
MSSTQSPFDEIQHLRRSLREIVAISALPAVWTGDEPRTIGEGLADVLQNLLRLEFVYVCIQLAPDTGPVEVLRADRDLDVAHWTHEVRRALAPWLKTSGAPLPSSIPNPLGSGRVRIAAVPLGYTGQYGVVMAGSRQGDFPTELDRLLLSVGANQAATALQGARLLAALREADRLKDNLLAREQAARAEAEAARTQVITILERVTDAFIALDREWRLTYLNRAAGQVFQRLHKTPEALIGTNLWEEFPELIGSTFEQEWHRAVAEQVTVEFEAFYPPLNAWLEVHAYPSTDGLSIYFQDITVRKQAEAQLQEDARILEILQRVGQALAAELDLQAIVQRVTDECTALTSAKFGAFFYNVLNEQGESYLLYTLAGVPREAFASFPMPRNTPLFGPTFGGEAVVRLDDVTKDPHYGQSPPHYGMPPGHLPVCSYLAVPVLSRTGEVLGGLFFGHPEPGVFTERDERLVVGIASQAAVAIDNARLYQQAREAEARLRHQLDLTSATMRSLGEGLYVLDREGRVTFLNPAAEQLLGWTAAELLGRSMHEVIYGQGAHGRSVPVTACRLLEVLHTGTTVQGDDNVFTRRDGTTFPATYTASPILSQGEAVGVVVAFQDITQRRQAETALEQSRRRLQALFDHTLDAILLADDQGHYIDVNPAACALFGYSREELLQRTLWDLTPSPDHVHGQQLWQAFLAAGTQSGEYSLCHKNGALVEVEYLAVANIVPGVHLSALRDITERKRAEARQRLLAEASATLAASLDYETTLTNIAQLAVPSLADWCVIDMREEGRSIRRVAAAHADPLKEPLLRDMQRRYPLDPQQPHAILAVLHSGRAKLYPELSEARVAAAVRDAEQLRMFQELGLESVMIVPLVAGGRTLGAMSLVSADAGRRYAVADLAFAEDLAGRCALAIENARLYREAQEATRAKEESLALLDTLLASAPVGLGFLDRELRYVRLNPALAAINGMPLEAHLGRTTYEVNPQLPPVVDSLRRYALETGKPVVNAEVSGETRAALGQVRHWLVSYYPVRTPAGHLLGLGIVLVDITERKQAEQQLQASLKEKEVLLQEIHHRVKNNMQVISSLLNLQADYSQDPATLALIADSQQRIQSMALIHESLYRSHDLGHINFAAYLRTLADELWRAYRIDDTHIRLHLDAEDVYLDIDKATPCGLLLNELVANCLKHAFPPGNAGDVHIGLHTTPERRVRLVVRDTGCGFPEGIDFRHTDSLGLQLVTTLTEQLQGTIALERQAGTTFTITFPA